VDSIARDRPALKILFYVISAEAVAKIVNNYNSEGQSKKHVIKFFEEICDSNQQTTLEKAFLRDTGKYLNLREAIELLYDVRCDVAHEAKYFSFHLKSSASNPPETTIVGGFTGTSHITANDLRGIILAGSVNGARQVLSKCK
jgi:hypothetical protein